MKFAILHNDGASPASSLPSCQRPHVDELERPMQEVWGLVAKMWKRRKTHPKQWAALIALLRSYEEEAEDDVAHG